jgi:hypothetical protein
LRFGGSFRPGKRRPVVAIIQLHQQITCVDHLVIGDGNLLYKPGYLRCNDSNVTANVGIVRSLYETSHGRPVIAVSSHSQRTEPDGGVHEQTFQSDFPQQW